MVIAAQLAGISESTLYSWLEKGRAGGGDCYQDFLEKTTRAKAEAEAKLIKNIRINSADDWRAAAWILERRHPSRWANAQRIRDEAERQAAAIFDNVMGQISDAARIEILQAITPIPSSDETPGNDSTNNSGGPGA